MLKQDNQNQTISNQKYPKPSTEDLEDKFSDANADLSSETLAKEEATEDKSSCAEASEDKYKRALADYQNLLKQTAKEKYEFTKYANKHLLHEILPVYDNLKLALKHAKKHVKESQENNNTTLKDVNIYEGIEHIVRQFKDVLKNVGIEEIKTIGEKFDHHTMEAVEGKGEFVVKEVRSGYCLNGKVIVVARVVVG